MKRLSVLIFLTVLCTTVGAQDGNLYVAIAPVTDTAGILWDSVSDGMERGLEYYKNKSLYSKVKVIPMKKVKKMMRKNDIYVRDLAVDSTLQKIGKLMEADLIAFVELTSDGMVLLRVMHVATGDFWIVDSNPYYGVFCVGAAVQDILYRNIMETTLHVKNVGYVGFPTKPDITNGLAGYWTFDKQNGTDESEYENTSSITGKKPEFIANTPSGYGYACANESLYVKEHLLNARQWTLCLWVYIPKRWRGEMYLIKEYSKNNHGEYYGHEVLLSSDRQLTLTVDKRIPLVPLGNNVYRRQSPQIDGKQGTVTIPQELYTPGWHHVSIHKWISTLGDEGLACDIDGQLVHGIFCNPRKYEGEIRIGVDAPAIDNVRIYERFLPIEEIKKIHESEKQQ